MKTHRYDTAVVFGIEPIKDPVNGGWIFEDQVYECLDMASELLEEGVTGSITVSGNRAVRQRYTPGEWHPLAECRMGKNYLVSERGCSPGDVHEEDTSEDCASNNLYTTRLALSLGMKRIVAITTPVREERAWFFGDLVVAPYCEFDVITTNHKSTPEEEAKHAHTLRIQQFGFRHVKPGDLDALEALFYDDGPYPYFRYHDLAYTYDKELAAQQSAHETLIGEPTEPAIYIPRSNM